MENIYVNVFLDSLDALEDLTDWLRGEYQVFPADRKDAEVVSLGEGESGIKIILSGIKDHWKRFVALLKAWAANFNKEFELTIKNGEKQATIKCPCARMSDENLNQAFSTIAEVFQLDNKKETDN